jgi:hypothetical protein
MQMSRFRRIALRGIGLCIFLFFCFFLFFFFNVFERYVLIGRKLAAWQLAVLFNAAINRNAA